MTRKRYVKLLMSMGYTKRYAELRAKMDVSLHGSYSTAWTIEHDTEFRGIFYDALKQICENIGMPDIFNFIGSYGGLY